MYQYFKRQKLRHVSDPLGSILSEARLILPEDGSQRIRNMSEFFVF